LMPLTVEELFGDARIVPGGVANWGDPIPESGPGVYVVSIAGRAPFKIDSLPAGERRYWNPHELIIYIGRSAQLSHRLRQFYRHKYGNRSPHHGGQAILTVQGPKRIDWAAV
jgi:hypothetical protein